MATKRSLEHPHEPGEEDQQQQAPAHPPSTGEDQEGGANAAGAADASLPGYSPPHADADADADVDAGSSPDNHGHHSNAAPTSRPPTRNAPPPSAAVAASTTTPAAGSTTPASTFPPPGMELPPDFRLYAMSRSEFLKGPALFFEKEDMEAYLQQANAPHNAKYETFDNFKQAAVYLLKDYLTSRAIKEQQQQSRPAKKQRTAINLRQKQAPTPILPAPSSVTAAAAAKGTTPIAPAPPHLAPLPAQQHQPYPLYPPSQHLHPHPILLPTTQYAPIVPQYSQPMTTAMLSPHPAGTGGGTPPSTAGTSHEQGSATSSSNNTGTKGPVPILPRPALAAAPRALVVGYPVSISMTNNNSARSVAGTLDTKFEEKIQLLEQFKHRYGHVKVNPKKCEEKYHCLKKWLYQVRATLRKYEQDPELAGPGWDEARVQRLRALGVDPDATDHTARWERNFALLQEYQAQFGHCFIPSRTEKINDEKWHPLSHFREFNMKHMKLYESDDPSKSNLTEDRYHRLKDLVGDWRLPKGMQQRRPYQKNPETLARKREKEEAKFEEMFDRLLEYKNTGGNVNEHPDDKVKRWILNQRLQYRNLKDSKPTTMTNDRLARLNSLGLRLKMEQEYMNFDERALQWLEAGGSTGHIKNRLLREWVKKTKIKYIKWKRGEKTNLTQERIDKLTQFGFQWPTQEEVEAYDPNAPRKKWLTWDDRFQQLLEVSSTLFCVCLAR
jgi:hypothetical protein